MDITTFLIIAVPLVIIAVVWMTYNSLVTLRMRVKEAWADIDVQLKKRYDLLPDLIETARKATAVDENILTKVTQLRSAAMEDSAKNANPEERAKVEGQLSAAVRDIKIQVEAYPEIRSHAELLNLMEKVTDIEEKISYARRFYNQNAMEYNTKLAVFPSVVIANFFAFTAEPFFAASEEEKKDIQVKL